MMGESWMYWSDGVGFYRTMCFGLLAVLAGMVVWSAGMPKAGRLGSAFFVVALCSFVFLARWPGLFYPQGFNPDEDQLLAAARALVLDPVFFRAAEAGSSGPLNVYPLLASLVVGAWPTLFSARLVGLGMICVALVAVALVFGLGFMIFWRVGSPNIWAGLAREWVGNEPGPISQKILEAADGRSGRLCVWGYNPTYYTETGLVQANRLSNSSAIFNDNALCRFFLETYLEDLHRNRPVVFVDAVAPDQFVMMTKREKHGHEVMPEVRDFVAANYELFEEIDGVRIYRWRRAEN